MIALAVAALTLAPGATAGWIWLQLHLDERRTWAAELDTWHTPGVEQLAEPREQLTALAVRVPGANLDLTLGEPHPAQAEAPSVDTLDRVLAGLRSIDSERVNNDYVGRHRPEKVSGSSAQRARIGALRVATAEWAELVAPLTQGWCGSCKPGRDGERPHQSCPGCPCPCGMVEPVLIGRPPAGGLARAHTMAAS